MAWDWEADDILEGEDDGQDWVCYTSNFGNRDHWRCYEGNTVQYTEDAMAPNGHVPGAAEPKQTV